MQKEKEKKEGKRAGNWSMPLHKLPLVMAFYCARKCRFHTRIFQKKSPYIPWEEGNPIPHPPPARSFRSLALAPIDKSWVHHCPEERAGEPRGHFHWRPYQMLDKKKGKRVSKSGVRAVPEKGVKIAKKIMVKGYPNRYEVPNCQPCDHTWKGDLRQRVYI